MKVSMFHLFSHRDLPADFEKRYHSVWVDPPWSELATPEAYGSGTEGFASERALPSCAVGG